MDRAGTAALQWGEECPELDTGPMVLLGRLAEITALLSQKQFTPLFSRFGLQPGEFDVLATLRRSGRPYALSPTQLYEAAMISSGSMTNRIDRLEAAKLVERRANPQDRRSTLVSLTGQGFALIERMMGTYVAAQAQAVSALEADEVKQLSALLAKLIAAQEVPTQALT